MKNSRIKAPTAAGAALLAALLAGGCATTGRPSAPSPGGHGELSEIEALETTPLGRARDVADVDVLALTPEMKRFAKKYLTEFRDPYDRAQMLRYVITQAGLLGFQYDQAKTRSAVDAFRYRNGNCLTLSNLYVALGRYVGLDARYQDVSLGQSWTKTDDLYLLSRHINVKGRLAGGRSYVMDFIHIDTEYIHDAQVVSDEWAKAEYYNNIGADFLQAGNNSAALIYFKKAIVTDPRIDYIWSNLGTAYSRASEYVAAEAAFKKALELNDRNWSAINNLAVLYQKIGRLEEAEEQLAGIERFRLKNPYYRLALSERAYQAGDYKEAIAHLKRAVAMKPDEHEFYFALAKSYYRRGDRDKAESHFDKARQLASAGPAYERYRKGLDTLLERERS